MILISIPGLTALQLTTWVQNKDLPMNTVSGGFFDPAAPLALPAGFSVQVLVDDSRWLEVRPLAASLCVLTAAPRVRVTFDSIDVAQAGGRPVGRTAWVYADGHQEEA